MKAKIMQSDYLSFFCAELCFALRSGMSISAGIKILEENNEVPEMQSVLQQLGEEMLRGASLSAALNACGQFPDEMVNMIAAGEKTGHLEESLNAMSSYYDNTYSLGKKVRSSVLMPAILLVLILAVIAVLIVVVLPIFGDVYATLGVELSGLAGAMLRLSEHMAKGIYVVFGILSVALVALVAAAFLSNGSEAFVKFFSGGTVGRKLSDARFVSVLSTAMSSGLRIEKAVELAAETAGSDKDNYERYRVCAGELMGGKPITDALRGILPMKYCQILTLGLRSGFGDIAMTETANRLQTEAEEILEKRIAFIEPAIVLILSVIMGIVILSFMLPLVNIMSAIV